MTINNDTFGFFWKDAPASRARSAPRGFMPPIPDTKWRRLKTLPDLSAAKALCIDLETYDPDLLTHGPGWARGVGHIVGLAVSTEDGAAFYLPMRHEVLREQNHPPEQVLAWAKDNLTRARQPKLGANLIYDMGWLAQEGITVQGELHDVQFAEALLSEAEEVNLEALAQKYLGEGKSSNLLYRWLAAYYGGAVNPKQRSNIFRAPASLVASYAQGDVTLPFRILAKQWPLLQKNGLVDLYRMECALMPLLIAMRFAGVPVDVKKAEQVREELIVEETLLASELRSAVGFEVNVNASESLSRAFDSLRIPYGRTEKGAPSFTKDFLKAVEHPFAKKILELKKVKQTRGTFIEKFILGANIDGIVYPSFNQLRGDEDGTRSGRFSSSGPNYQQIPARDARIGPLIRSIVVPDFRLGHKRWRKKDYSQIEYRFFAHFATGKGSDELRAHYVDNPKTDYHELTLDMVAPVAGWDVSTKELRKHWRKPVKGINFGLLYGMGIKHLAEVLGVNIAAAKALFAKYHTALPFVAATMSAASLEAATNGIVRTILGRISHFDLWTSREYDEDARPLPYDAAIRAYGPVKRSHTHKGLNRILQGSAADLMKTAMLRCWQDGVFAETGVPRLTVHDELDFSDPGDKDAAFAECVRIMQTALPLRVPVLVDTETGPSWGQCS